MRQEFRAHPNNGLFRVLTAIIVSVLLLLFGMYVVSNLAEGVLSTYLDLIVVIAVIILLTKMTSLQNYVGRSNTITFVIICFLIALFNIFFSTEYVFNDFLAGRSRDVSFHIEHSLSYDRMTAIADIIRKGDSFSSLDDLNLNQYKFLYTYYSLMFVVGGDVVTHICIWNIFHLALSCVLLVLIAERLGVKNTFSFIMILFIGLSQPVLDCLFAYHRDIVGQAALCLGLFVFICTYKNGIYSIAAFPFYAFLFFSYRLQYLVVAIILYLWSVLKGNKKNISFVIGIGVIVIVVAAYASMINWTSFFMDELNVGVYVDSERYSFWGNLILGLVGFFPWTNLTRDINWTYHLFAYVQGPMNIVMLYYVIMSFKKDLSAFLRNPILLCALFLTLFAFFGAGHTTYMSVAMPLFAICIPDVPLKKILQSFIILVIMYIVLSFAYEIMGLTGSGFLK